RSHALPLRRICCRTARVPTNVTSDWIVSRGCHLADLDLLVYRLAVSSATKLGMFAAYARFTLRARSSLVSSSDARNGRGRSTSCAAAPSKVNGNFIRRITYKTIIAGSEARDT